LEVDNEALFVTLREFRGAGATVVAIGDPDIEVELCLL